MVFLRLGLRIAAVVCTFLLIITVFNSPARAQLDSDLDGLEDSFELSTIYAQTAAADGLPKAVPDEGLENAAATLLPWSGVVTGAFAEFTVDHPTKEELTVQAGYWDGSSWQDRYVWDPGSRLMGVTLTSPPADTFLSGVVTVTASVTEDEIVDRVEFYLDDSLIVTLGQPSSPETYSFSWDTRNHPAGNHQLKALSVDKVGGQASHAIGIKIDNANPTVSITNPVNGAVVGGSVTISASASDDYGVREVRFYVDGGLIATDTASPYEAGWNPSSGEHVLMAQAVDHAGKTASHSIVVTADLAGPSVSFAEPSSGQYLRGTYRVKVWATDDVGVSKVEFSLDGGGYIDITANFDGTYYWYDWNTGSVGNGGHTLTAKATDGVGRSSTAAVSVTVDNTAPSVSITNPRGGATVSGVIRIDASASDNIGLSVVYFYVDGAFIGSDTSAPYYVYWDSERVSDGKHTLKALAIDYAGNGASHTIGVTVSNGGGWICTKPPCPTSVGPEPLKESRGKDKGDVTLSATTTASTSGITVSATTYTVSADLIKDRSQVTQVERDNRILPAEFDAALFHSQMAWRIVIRDWVASAGSGGGGGGGGGGGCVKDCPVPTGVDSLATVSESSIMSSSTTTQGTLQAFALRLEERSDPNKWDTDGDGLGDGQEVNTFGTYPVTVDTDGDAARDDFEVVDRTITLTINGVSQVVTVKTDPLNPDTDLDGLPDGEEYDLGMDGVVTHPVDADTDDDGLWDGDEVTVHYSNATLSDTDGDGFSDFTEVNPRSLVLTVNGVQEARSVTTLAYAEDSDGDGLRDWEEWFGSSVYGVRTDPSDPDTDGDGLPDGQERYVMTFKTSRRKPILDYTTVWTEPLYLVVNGGASRIKEARALVGITHTWMGDLVVDLYRGSTSVNLRNRIGGSADNNFTAYNLFDLGFTAGDIASAANWYLRVQDKAGADQGQVEYVELQVTVRLDPTRSDSDGDGLNDTEETTMGLDGFLTDPWSTDTDGDGWPDNEWFAHGTDPTNRDTDGDGVIDPQDRVPLGDAFLSIWIESINVVGDDTARPFVGVRVGSEESWTQTLNMPSGTYNHFFPLNVDDSSSAVTFRVEAWSFDGGNQHGEVYISTKYWVDDGGQVWRIPVNYRDLSLSVGPGSTRTWDLTPDLAASPRADPLRIHASIVVPFRGWTRLLVPTDYSTVYNVTDAEGNVVERRYLGEDRFVVLMARVFYGTGLGAEATQVRLIPRDLFFQSELYHRLNQTDGLTAGGLLGNVKAVWRDIGRENEDGLHMVLNAGGLMDEDWAALADMALNDPAGNRIATSVDVTFQLPLLGVPKAALAAVPYEPLSISPSYSYQWSSGGSTTVSIWEALWAGAQAILDETLNWVRTAIAFYVEFWNKVVDSLVQFGLWLSAVVNQATTAVQDAVRMAQEAFGHMVDWLRAFAEMVVRAALAIFVDPLTSLVSSYLAGVALALLAAKVEYEVAGAITDSTLSNLDSALAGSLFWILIGAATAVQVALWVLMPFTLSFSWILTFAVSIMVTYLVIETLSHDTTEPDRSFMSSGYMGPEAWPAVAEDTLEAQAEWEYLEDFWRNFARTMFGVWGFYFAKTGLLFSGAAILDSSLPFNRGQIVGVVFGILGLALTLAVIGGQAADQDWVFAIGIGAIVLGVGSVILSVLSITTLLEGFPRYLGFAGLALGVLGIFLSIGALVV